MVARAVKPRMVLLRLLTGKTRLGVGRGSQPRMVPLTLLTGKTRLGGGQCSQTEDGASDAPDR